MVLLVHLFRFHQFLMSENTVGMLEAAWKLAVAAWKLAVALLFVPDFPDSPPQHANSKAGRGQSSSVEEVFG